MGKYAYMKIKYYIISQANGFVNRFCKNIFEKMQKALAPFGNEGVFLLYELFRYYRGITLATISAMQLMTNRIIPTFI